jgi:CAAX protease family protein
VLPRHILRLGNPVICSLRLRLLPCPSTSLADTRQRRTCRVRAPSRCATNNRASLCARATKWRIPLSWYLTSGGIPAGAWLVSAIAVSALGPPLAGSGLSFASFPVIFVVNYLQEVGWRGFALPSLLAQSTGLLASVALGLIWVLFHVPLYWKRPLEGPLFLAPIVPISILVTCLFLATRGSVPARTVFHAIFNTFSVTLLADISVEPLLISVSVALALTALLFMSRYGSDLSAGAGQANGLSAA